jgi:hypothetical protein
MNFYSLTVWNVFCRWDSPKPVSRMILSRGNICIRKEKAPYFQIPVGDDTGLGPVRIELLSLGSGVYALVFWKIRARRPMKHSSGDEFLADCVQDDLGGAVKVQFLHQIRPVRLHCVHTQVQKSGHFLVGFPFRQELQNFPLAFR